MRDETRNAIRSAEELGHNVKEMANIAPTILANLIDLGAAVVDLPWSALAGTADIAAIKADEAVDMVV